MPDLDLRPCPFCGEDAADPTDHNGLEYVFCLSCTASGPTALTPEEAAANWNRRANPWQPIETAPENVLVLLYCPERGVANQERIEVGYASHGSTNAISSNMSYHAWATHWTSLPEPPLEKRHD